jgi:SAM-dependent methyltransferase
MSTNFGAAAEDYATFRAGFPDSFFYRLASFGLVGPGTTVVDVGTGTGTLARGFARRGATVIAIDPDNRLVHQARQLDSAASVTIDYRTGTAEQIPLPDGVADIVTAGQCWHWFEGQRAAKEFARIAKPRGQVIIAHFDWLPLPGNVVQATERLIKQHNPSWHFDGGNGFHSESVPYLYAEGFREFETFSYDVDVPYTPEAWRGRIRASVGVGASLPPPKVQAFDAELKQLLVQSFASDVLHVPHRVFAVLARLTEAG